MATQADQIPQHIAFIMDGNRRWARQRGLPDIKGHEAGAAALEKVLESAAKMGIKTVTVYAMSTENIRERAIREVKGLFDLIRLNYHKKMKQWMENRVGISIIGELRGMPTSVQKIVKEVRQTVIDNESIHLNIALNYGGKKELVDAVKDIIKKGIDVDKINEEMIEKHLYTSGQSNPELVVRTGGYIRLSNFLLWQTAYSELYFTKVLWPDFDEKELKKAVQWYQDQKRNFGK